MERIDYIHAEFDSPALIEEYIEGRELYVSVLGNEKPEALPIVEMDLSKLPEGTPKIAGSEVKWEEETEAYKRTRPFLPDDLDEGLTARIQDVAVQAYTALELRDYGRIDFRLAADETLHLLEVNPNPYLLSGAEFAMAARKSGRSYSELIDHIVNLAMARYANGGGV
jgi:D-alanine-D-alanine ligase